jgi:hypothetical protein
MAVDHLRDSETLRLVTAFYHIDDAIIRKTIVDMAEAAVNGEAFEAKIDAAPDRRRPVN